MKKILFIAAAMAAIVACNKNEPTVKPQMPLEGNGLESISVVLSGGSRATKATSAKDATLVSSATIYVFDAEGLAIAHSEAAKVGNDYQATFTLTKASGLTVAAVVNKPVSSINDLTGLRAKTTSLTDNASALVMYGEKSGVSTGGTAPIVIDVKHIAVMAEIDKITNNFSEAVYANGQLTLKGVYLINVPTGAPAFSAVDSYLPAAWANKTEFVSDTSVNGFLYDALSGTLALGASHSTPHYFYGYPNNVASDHTGDTWDNAGAFTRLVVEVDWKSADNTVQKTWYYPITFENIFKANNKLVISELIITKPGSEHPNDPIENESATFKINILDWNTVLMGNGGVVTF